MTDFQWLYELQEETQSSNTATKIHTLPKSGVISALQVEFRATNGATSNRGAEINRIVERIEVFANGSTVITSLTGQEATRLAWLKTGRFPSALLSEAPDDVQFIMLPIFFGRFHGDKDWALDLSKFNSVDVRVTYDLAEIRAVGATGFVTGTANISIMSLKATPPAGFTPRGYLSSREIQTFTSAASGDEVVDLPIGRPYIGVGVFAFEAAIADDVDITRVQLRADRGSKILYDRQWNQGQRENANQFRVDPWVNILTFSSDADTNETWTGDLRTAYYTNVGAITVGTTDTSHSQWASIAGGQVTWESWLIEGTATYTANAADTTDSEKHVSAAGVGVGNFLYVPLDPNMEWTDPLESTRHGNLDVTLTNGGADATVGVVLEEIAKY